MCRNAVVAGAQDRVRAIEAVHCSASRARRALVAAVAARRACVGLAEVRAARALQQVAAGGRHVAELRRCAGKERLRQYCVGFLHIRIPGEIRVAHHGADAEAAIGQLLDLVEREQVDIDQGLRRLHIQLHQVDQRGAAGDELRLPRARQGLVDARSFDVVEGFHISLLLVRRMNV